MARFSLCSCKCIFFTCFRVYKNWETFSYLFKFLNGNRPKIFNDKVLDSDEFVAKIEKAQERTDVQAVFDWSIFDE